jgi:methionine biosynthesis protein MetW
MGLTNDNRQYDYTHRVESLREEYEVIVNGVVPGSSVFDFGCGNGSLMTLLRDQKSCRCIGAEISHSGAMIARQKGFQVFETRIDRLWSEYQNKEFDYAICNVTVQMVMYPEILLQEMGRISKKQIVSFPNFAHYRNRLDNLIHGRMPQPGLFGYSWYSTGQIHQLSIRDFIEFCRENSFHIEKFRSVNWPKSFWKRWLIKTFPNLFSNTTIFFVESKK